MTPGSGMVADLVMVVARAQEEAGEGGAAELQEEVDSLHQRLHEVADREAELLEQVPAVYCSAHYYQNRLLSACNTLYG